MDKEFIAQFLSKNGLQVEPSQQVLLSLSLLELVGLCAHLELGYHNAVATVGKDVVDGLLKRIKDGNLPDVEVRR